MWKVVIFDCKGKEIHKILINFERTIKIVALTISCE